MNLNERIEFYRALGFFEKNSNLNTEELKDFLMKKSEDSYFGELGEEMEEIDIAVLSLDLEKVWFVEDCFVYGSLFENEQEMYISSVKKLSEICSFTKAYSLNQELWHAYSCAANCNDCLKRYNDKINVCRNAVSLLSQKKEKDSTENWWLEFFSREIEKTESAVRGS